MQWNLDITNLSITNDFLYPSLQCRRFLWARNLLAKAPCWNFPKRGYFYSPQSSTVIKSKMAATTILRTRTRFRPPKRRLHCRLVVPKYGMFEKELKMAGDKNKHTIWALLLSLLALTTTYTFQQNYHNNQVVVTPNEVVGLYCRD